MRPEHDPYYKAQLKAIELEYMLDSPTVTNMPNRSIETRNDDPKPLPDIMSFGQCIEFATNPANELEEIIEGCLHEGCKMIISGSRKAGKTWSLINLAIAASNGMPWMGMPVKQRSPLLRLRAEEVLWYRSNKAGSQGNVQGRYPVTTTWLLAFKRASDRTPRSPHQDKGRQTGIWPNYPRPLLQAGHRYRWEWCQSCWRNCQPDRRFLRGNRCRHSLCPPLLKR